MLLRYMICHGYIIADTAGWNFLKDCQEIIRGIHLTAFARTVACADLDAAMYEYMTDYSSLMECQFDRHELSEVVIPVSMIVEGLLGFSSASNRSNWRSGTTRCKGFERKNGRRDYE